MSRGPAEIVSSADSAAILGVPCGLRFFRGAAKRAKIKLVPRYFLALLLTLFVCASAAGQVQTIPPSDKGPGETQAPPRSDKSRANEESSSRDTRIDLSPPRDDVKNHPYSGAALSDAKDAAGDNEANPDADVQEFHPWDPHKAAKNVEVGDFYFKKKNYRAALDRYREALLWKDNDAIANFRMAECLEKLNQPAEASQHYQEYLKILPHGEFSEVAQKALDRLKEKSQASEKK
jgi:tetratricopeptide (TPR) repeat protein